MPQQTMSHLESLVQRAKQSAEVPAAGRSKITRSMFDARAKSLLDLRKKPLKETQLNHGWFSRGVAKTRKDADVMELVRFHRATVRMNFSGVPVPQYPPYLTYLTTHLTKWIHDVGLQTAMDVAEYTIKNWRQVQNRYQLDAPYPDLRVIYGFRKSLIVDVKSKGSGKRKWGAHWKETDLEEAYGNGAKVVNF